jgi:putative transposase
MYPPSNSIVPLVVRLEPWGQWALEELLCSLTGYTGRMSVTLAAKLKLITTAEQAEFLRRTALAYREALNYTSRVAYDQGKVSNTMRLQQLVYRDLRRQFRLSAQLACNVARQVGATYAGLWTKAKQHAGHRARGLTRKR